MPRVDSAKFKDLQTRALRVGQVERVCPFSSLSIGWNQGKPTVHCNYIIYLSPYNILDLTPQIQQRVNLGVSQSKFDVCGEVSISIQIPRIMLDVHA